MTISNNSLGRLSFGPSPIAADGLVLHLDAHNKRSYSGSGSVWKDMTHFGNDFIIHGSPAHNGLYFSLDGSTSQYFQAYPFDHPTGDFTIELYERVDVFTQTALYSYATSSDDNEGLLYAPGGTIYIYGPDGGGSTGYELSEDVFHQIVRTRSYVSGEEKLYVDGKLVATMTIAAGQVTYTAGSFNIGQEQDSPGGGFDPNQTLNGDVAMVRIYDRVLSPSEVVTNYQQIKARVY
jgi:hypothetical protein